MLPNLPLELWHRILEHTCTCRADNNNPDGDNDYCFDCPTLRNLSVTCRELRQISRRFRFHSVEICGWEQLLAFEKLLASNVEQDKWKPYHSIVYLRVELEQFWRVAYPSPSNPWSVASEDSSYVHTSDSEAGEGGEDEETDDDHGDGDEDDEVKSGLMEERAYEFAELSDMELAEVADDHTAITEDAAKEDSAHTWFDGRHSAQELSFLLACSPTPLARIEFVVYSALRRLLEACAPTLEVFSISWNPVSMFFIEAVFPLLPKLQVLRWELGKSGPGHVERPISPKRASPIPRNFPALYHLDIKANSDVKVLQDVLSMCPDVQIVTVGNEVLWRGLEIRNKKVRIPVYSSYRGRFGLHPNRIEACRTFEIPDTMQDNDFYVVPETKVLHLNVLLKRLTAKVEEWERNNALGRNRHRIQYGIDICTDLMERFDGSPINPPSI